LTQRNLAPAPFDVTASIVHRFGGIPMDTNVKLFFAILFGVGIGASAIHELHAQASPLAYVISEIDVVDVDGYAREYIPLANKALAGAGQKKLASGGATLVADGEPLKSRVTLSVFENMEKAQAAYSSANYLEAQKVGEKYARFRIFAIEAPAP
jgi:uncharacterized protein (DUF1330 family)